MSQKFLQCIKQNKPDEARQILIEEAASHLDLSCGKLFQLSESQWQAFWQGLAGSSVTSLNLSTNHISHLSTSQWQVFWKGLAGTTVTSLDLNENTLCLLSASQWQAFGKGLTGTAVTSLNLGMNDLYELSEGQWQFFWQGLAGSSVTSLNLSNNDLSQLSTSQWRAFWKNLAGTAVTSLDLSNNDLYKLSEGPWYAFGRDLAGRAAMVLERNNELYKLSESQWQVFWQGLAGTVVKSLALGSNGLCSLSESEWQIFGECLSNSSIMSLDLRGNSLHQLSESQWQTLGKGLARTAVTSLDLSHNGLSQLSENQWWIFGKCLGSSSITSLDLGGNFLSHLSESEWQIFGKCLSNSSIMSLDLRGNSLHQLSESEWQALGKSLMGTAVTSLYLGDNFLSQLKESQWQALGKGLAGSSVTSLYLGDNFLSQLKESQWQALGKGLAGSSVTSLYLSNNNLSQLSEREWQALGKGLVGSSVTSLDLGDNQLYRLSASQWQALCKGLAGSSVKSLNLGSNNLLQLSEASLRILADAMNRSAVKRLVLSDAEFDVASPALAHLIQALEPIDMNFNTRRYTYGWLADFLHTTSNLPFYTLDLSRLQLDDRQLAQEWLPVLRGHCPRLHILKLSHNQLTLEGLTALLQAVEAGDFPCLERLDMSYNYIELHSPKQLTTLETALAHSPNVKTLELTGNCISSKPKDTILTQVLKNLLSKTKVSIGEFLSARFVKLSRLEQDNFQLVMEITQEAKAASINKQETLSLNYLDLVSFNQLKTDERGLVTDEDVLHTCTLAINRRRLELDSALLAQVYQTLPSEQQNAIVATLLDYHPRCSLMSRIKTHPVLSTDLPRTAPSLLIPHGQLTPRQGFVYLIVHQNRHTLLGYEYLTDEGQRVFHVAHLTVQGGTRLSLFANSGPISIDFETDNSVLKQVQKYQKNYAITGLQVATDKLRGLHEKITTEKKHGVASRYKWFISGSSQQEDKEVQEKRVVNCLKWATDHLKDDLGIALKIAIYNPHQIVSTLQSDPQSLLGQTAIAVVGNKNQAEVSESSTCLIM